MVHVSRSRRTQDFRNVLITVTSSPLVYTTLSIMVDFVEAFKLENVIKVKPICRVRMMTW